MKPSTEMIHKTLSWKFNTSKPFCWNSSRQKVRSFNCTFSFGSYMMKSEKGYRAIFKRTLSWKNNH